MYVEIELPAITGYSQGFPQYWLKTMFIQSPSNRYQINALSSTYVRLVDAALFEYQSGADKLREFWGTHTSMNLGAMHRSISHFETCISNMSRATNCFCRLRRDRNQDPLALTINKKKAKFASDSVAKKIHRIRNDIHHFEEMVMDGRIGEGQSFALKPDGPEVPHPTESKQTIKTIDRLVIGGNQIKFCEIATGLNEMASFVALIADFLPNSSQRTNDNNTV